MTTETLQDLAEFESYPTPEPAPDTDADRVEPIVSSLSDQEMYLHGTESQQRLQFLAAEIDKRPLLRFSPRERYAKIVVDITHTGYSLTADAVRRIYSIAEPYFDEAESTPSDLEFKFRPAGTDTFSIDPPRAEVRMDGLEIEAAKDLLGDLSQMVGEYSDFVNLQEDDSGLGPSEHLPREGAPPLHQPDGVEDPFQFAPIENKSITSEQIEDHFSRSTLRAADKLIGSGRHQDQRYWGDASHGSMPHAGVSGFCKRYVQPPEPSCQVHISGGEIVDETCSSDDHDAPCKHTAAALMLAPPVSRHYL